MSLPRLERLIWRCQIAVSMTRVRSGFATGFCFWNWNRNVELRQSAFYFVDRSPSLRDQTLNFCFFHLFCLRGGEAGNCI